MNEMRNAAPPDPVVGPGRFKASARAFTAAAIVSAATGDPVSGAAAGMLTSVTNADTDSGDIAVAAAINAGTAIGTSNIPAAMFWILGTIIAFSRPRTGA